MGILSLIHLACANMVLELYSSLSSSSSSMEVSCSLDIRSKAEISCNIDDIFFVNYFLYCGSGLVEGCKPSMTAFISLDSLFHILRPSVSSCDYLSPGNLVLF